jgi:hypothetical protein
MKRAFPAAVCFLLLPICGSWAQMGPGPLEWLNLTRSQSGLVALATDAVLMDTAQAYAELLASLGLISHTGPDGSDPLTRYLRMGGTSARVGEILGAADGLAEVEKAWYASSDHRLLALKPYWTHVGWGRALAGSKEIWVVLFLQKRVEGLNIGGDRDGGMRVAGRLLPHDAAAPVLLSGITRFPPVFWDSTDGAFLFILPPEAVTGYIRLGYISRGGELEITDVITSPRGTEYREGGGRS